jgi:NAD(P)-dependent dehydrogenase (short-subunit alcohol dehydrogenase family)
MNLKLENLNVVVTGGSFGIGASIVKEFISEGAKVTFCGRDSKKIDKMLSSLDNVNGRLSGKVVDVTNEGAFKQWLSEIGVIDIFIANVSALSGDWGNALETDVIATVKNMEAVLPYLSRSQSAAITYIGSKASSFPTPGMDAYGAVKAAMTHYMKTLSKKLPSTVRVNTVSPGDTFFDGGFWDNVKKNNPEIYHDTLRANPMGRLCTPEEIAKVVTFVSSPIASFVSGVNWLVDGGATSHIQT